MAATEEVITRTPANVVALPSPEDMIQTAIANGSSIDTLERLFSLRDRVRKERAEEDFNTALAKFQGAMVPIRKNRTATVKTRSGGTYSYKYADAAQIQKAIAATLAGCGLSYRFETPKVDDGFAIKFILSHISGHSRTTELFMPTNDRDTGMSNQQKVAEAITFGKRQALTAGLGIVTEGDDTDGNIVDDKHDRTVKLPATAQRIVDAFARYDIKLEQIEKATNTKITFLKDKQKEALRRAIKRMAAGEDPASVMKSLNA